MARRMLALLAHPDDETFIFGGTIAHYAKQGVRITIVSATKGEMGRRMGNPPFITRESMPAVREQELREACRILGAEEPVFLGIHDKLVEFENPERLAERLRRIIQNIDPEVVFTFHPVWGGHPDHCAIGRAAVRAVEELEEAVQPPLYFISFGNPLKRSAWNSLQEADVVKVDVSDSLTEKLHAFRAHRTQTELEDWVWRPDEEAIRKFNRYEYFIAGNDKARAQGGGGFG